MEEEKKDLCRVCLSTTKRKYYSLFEKRKNYVVFDQINSFTNVQIHENDGFPSKICRSCLSELETAINFREKCEGSNLILRNSFANLTKTSDDIDIKDVVVKKEEPPELDPQVAEFFEDHFFDTAESFEPTDVIKPEKSDLNNIELGPRPSRAIDHHLQCDDCKQYFKSKCKLKVHWKKVHLTEKLLCSCKRQFKSIIAFNRHKESKKKSCLATQDLRVEGIGKSRVFYCKECEYKSFRIKDMITHQVIHTGDRPYKCDLCPKTCTQQSSLLAHKESAHGEYKAEMACQYCGKFIKGRNRIYRHLKRHTEQSVQCEVCLKTLKGKVSLQQHMRRHSGVKSYTCEKCAHSFYTIAELSNHKRTAHNKVKVWFKCDLCEYKASRKEIIKRHKAKHTETNVPCTICGMFLESAEKLIVHQHRHFEEKKYSCPYCDLKFFRRDTVPKHIKSKHAAAHQINHQRPPGLPVKEEGLDKQFNKVIRYGDMIGGNIMFLDPENRPKSGSPIPINDNDHNS
ncbi:zinc-finger associated domain (zf-AD) domain-containing protein [Phthorimaea operculella]|nr:zinc-finger associated domain (zf-AD) domain-containing protein [Phthorimaea operculella]